MEDPSISYRGSIIPSGVLTHIRAHYRTLSKTEQLVAGFIEHDPVLTIQLPIKLLARRIGVSEASIVRCCRSLGYSGLRELKLALAAEAGHSVQLLHEDIAPTDSEAIIAQKVLSSNIQLIAHTLSILDHQALELAIRALFYASHIVFYGIGGSIPLALDAYYRFLRIGLPVALVTDPHMQAVSASQLPAGSVAFAISHPGSTDEILQVLQIAHKAGAYCILLGSRLNSPSDVYADVQLITATHETSWRTDAAASPIAHVSVLDALYIAALAMYKEDPQPDSSQP